MKTLTELTAEYYSLIVKDHHKDSDCHFYIQKIYSYGDEAYWQFLHYGYCWSVENFFQDEGNIKKYQEYCDKERFDFSLCSSPVLRKRAKEDVIITEFPQRQTEQEAEQDMRNFLEWAIEKEKQNDNSDC